MTGGRNCMLASPFASYFTAAVLPVDGGRYRIGMPAGLVKQIDRAAEPR